MTPPNDPEILSDERLDLLKGVLDTLIPPSQDGAIPGAGEIGLAATLVKKVPEFVPLLAAGLDALSTSLADRPESHFASLDQAERHSILEELADQQPAFIPGLLFQVYANYYQSAPVLEALGLQARPPYPVGHELESGDMDLLDPVLRRGPLYRDC